MEYKKIKPGLENKDSKKIKEKDRTERMAAAKQRRKFRNPVMCRDPKFENTAVEQSINSKVTTANVSNLILVASLYTTTFDFKYHVFHPHNVLKCRALCL
jgi:hypothetical protein